MVHASKIGQLSTVSCSAVELDARFLGQVVMASPIPGAVKQMPTAPTFFRTFHFMSRFPDFRVGLIFFEVSAKKGWFSFGSSCRRSLGFFSGR